MRSEGEMKSEMKAEEAVASTTEAALPATEEVLVAPAEGNFDA